MEIYTRKTIEKVKGLYWEYRKFLYNKIDELSCEISKVPAPENTPEKRARFQTQMPKDGWRKVNSGDSWGGEFSYAWIRSSYSVPKEFEGKKLLLMPNVGLVEGLLFLNGKASGIFDVCPDIPSDFRLHEVQPLTLDDKS